MVPFSSVSEMDCISVSPDTQAPHSGIKLHVVLSVIVIIILLPSVCDGLFLFPLMFVYETTHHCCQKLSGEREEREGKDSQGAWKKSKGRGQELGEVKERGFGCQWNQRMTAGWS